MPRRSFGLFFGLIWDEWIILKLDIFISDYYYHIFHNCSSLGNMDLKKFSYIHNNLTLQAISIVLGIFMLNQYISTFFCELFSARAIVFFLATKWGKTNASWCIYGGNQPYLLEKGLQMLQKKTLKSNVKIELFFSVLNF